MTELEMTNPEIPADRDPLAAWECAAMRHSRRPPMGIGITLLDCPGYMDHEGAARCGLPAEVEFWYTMESTDGPLESAKIRCPRGHSFNAPVEFLALRGTSGISQPAYPGPGSAGCPAPQVQTKTHDP